MRCESCQFENPSDFRFCGRCGGPLAAAAAPKTRALTQDRDSAERRQLTVLFCDLVGSTALSEMLDPEELHELLQRYQLACVNVIEHFGGSVAQYLGDGLLVYFGYPHAHEDDPRRAVHAGLGMLEAMRELSEELEEEHGIPLAVRVGVHTGLVVTGQVGAGVKKEHLAMGKTPNIAARVQGLAEPNTVLMSDAVYQLVKDYFTCEHRGAHSLKGISSDVDLYEPVATMGTRDRLDIGSTADLENMVGREREWQTLISCVEAVQGGASQTVLITGEPGIGKSYLLQRLRDTLRERGFAWWVCGCSPYHGDTPLYPIMELMEHVFSFTAADSQAKKRDKLKRALAERGFDDDAPLLFADMLSLPMLGAHRLRGISPKRKRERTLHSVRELIDDTARTAPLAIIVEDLHWADPSSRSLFDELVLHRPADSPPVLLLFSARPEIECSWSDTENLSWLTLQRLDDESAEALIQSVLRQTEMDAATVREIVAKADGIPLYVEELAKMLESTAAQAADDAHARGHKRPSTTRSTKLQSERPVPMTIQDSLMARLDSVGPAKEVAQFCSVLGREFGYALLSSAAPIDEQELRESLKRLVAEQVLFQHGALPNATFMFKHALICDAAYSSLLRKSRQEHHRTVAHVMAEEFAEIVENQPELIARHFTEANDAREAVEYWVRASKRALGVFANQEAVHHIQQGLRILEQRASVDRDGEFGLALHTALGSAMIAMRGYAAPEVKEAYDQAVGYSQEMGASAQLFATTLGLWTYYVVRSELEEALPLAEKLMRLVDELDEPEFSVSAHFAMGFTHFFLGDLATARHHFESSIAAHQSERDFSLISPTGDDHQGHSIVFLAWTLWYQGFPDKALGAARRAVSLARARKHPYGLVYALVSAATVYYLRGESAPAMELLAEAIPTAEEYGFSYWVAAGHFQRAATLAHDASEAPERPDPDTVARAIGYLEKTVNGYRSSGARMLQTYFLSRLIDHKLRLHVPVAVQLLDEMADALENTGEQAWRAEYYRLRAVSELASAAASGAPVESARIQSLLERAMDHAREQGALSLELRAAMSLTRFWSDDGRDDEARALLSPVYERFTEGQDTWEVTQARALLSQLRASADRTTNPRGGAPDEPSGEPSMHHG